VAQVASEKGFRWETVLVERADGRRREVAEPSAAELLQADDEAWSPQRELPVIAPGVETSVLRRHGMNHWHDLFPARQRVVLEALLDGAAAASAGDSRVAGALQAAIVGSTEMAGLASRWDARYLKAYEAVANHRISFTTLPVEPNVWGAWAAGRGTVSRRLEHIAKAALWLEERVGRPLTVEGPLDGQARRTSMAQRTDARVVAGGSQRMVLPAGRLDAAISDPPYHDDVHYAELSDLFRAWAGTPTGELEGDAIVRQGSGQADTQAYRILLEDIFAEVHRSLRPEAHFILSYANRHPGAWVALFSALQGAGFRTVGYTIVHSENETDHAKAGRRACNLDVLIDVVPVSSTPLRTHQPITTPVTDEERYCHAVGSFALRIGALPEGWEEDFHEVLRSEPFLAPVEGSVTA
jgi:adenine-specific DNA methylase